MAIYDIAVARGVRFAEALLQTVLELGGATPFGGFGAWEAKLVCLGKYSQVRKHLKPGRHVEISDPGTRLPRQPGSAWTVAPERRLGGRGCSATVHR